MQPQHHTSITRLGWVAAASAAILLMASGAASAADDKPLSPVDQGKKIAWEISKGNCLACHAMAGGELAGTMGPPMVAMKARFPKREDLFNKVWDIYSVVGDRNVSMPRFGPHGILSREEVERVVDYLYSL